MNENINLNVIYRPIHIKGKYKVVSAIFSTKHHAMEAYWGSPSIAPRILHLGARWR
jgi:hypothetical protein